MILNWVHDISATADVLLSDELVIKNVCNVVVIKLLLDRRTSTVVIAAGVLVLVTCPSNVGVAGLSVTISVKKEKKKRS